jgi:hypothetical protein
MMINLSKAEVQVLKDYFGPTNKVHDAKHLRRHGKEASALLVLEKDVLYTFYKKLDD